MRNTRIFFFLISNLRWLPRLVLLAPNAIFAGKSEATRGRGYLERERSLSHSLVSRAHSPPEPLLASQIFLSILAAFS